MSVAAPDAQTVALRLFEDAAAAKAAIERSTGDHAVVAMHLGRKRYLKRLGLPRIEPRYLCTDGRWRKWDNVPELAALG